MVFYGVLSKGCQRCRRLKKKCDQRKPGCLRCEKAKTPCPGFRNLADVRFRDDTKRTIVNSHAVYDAAGIKRPASAAALSPRHPATAATTPPRYLPLITAPLQPPRGVSEIGAHFFFSIYTCDEPPLSADHHTWLTQICCQHRHHHALRAAVEAAEMAGISSVFHAPEIAARARQEYGRALAATSQALSDPTSSILDTTFLTVIVLALYEFINFEKSDCDPPSAAHIKGAITLLEHRGDKQFDREHSRQLFYQLRSQMLFSFMEHDLEIPEVLLQLGRGHRPSFLGDMNFRLLSLRAAAENGSKSNPKAIYETARQMDRELEAWRETLPDSMRFKVANNAAPDERYFERTRHFYSDLWTAQLWNSWRTICIQVKQILRQSGISGTGEEINQDCKIRELSTDICVSVPEFMDSPRSVALIWSLLVVSRESLNGHSERAWAAEQLRRIGSSRNIR